MACVTEAISSVWPSGGAFATNSVAIVPPAPGRFSTMNDCPSESVRRCANRRATTSMPPPAAKPTRMRTVFAGYAGPAGACAQTAPASDKVKPSATPHSLSMISPSDLLSGDFELVYASPAVLGDKHVALRIHRDAMRLDELAGKSAGAPES